MSMPNTSTPTFTVETVMGLSPQSIAQTLQAQAASISALEQQLEWFKRQLFGKKSERFAPLPDAQQMHLGQLLGDLPATDAPEADSDSNTIPAHQRNRSLASVIAYVTKPCNGERNGFSAKCCFH